jgi:hypothetical protein
VIIGAFTPNLLNPRIVGCHPNLAPGACVVLSPNVFSPLSGPLPGDGGVGTKPPAFSDFFIIDEGLSNVAGVKGTFCGFNPPLNNATSPAGAAAFSLSSTTTVPVKFTLGQGSSCGALITNATALLSVSAVPSGSPVWPLKFDGHGNSSSIFDVTGKQYHLNLDVTGYAPGVYSICVSFQSGNASPVCTYMQLTP